MNDLVKEFKESADPLEFVNLSSEKKADRNYFKQDEIANDSMAQFLFNNEKAVFGPYLENNAYKISRVASVKMLPDSVEPATFYRSSKSGLCTSKKYSRQLSRSVKKRS